MEYYENIVMETLENNAQVMQEWYELTGIREEDIEWVTFQGNEFFTDCD